MRTSSAISTQRAYTQDCLSCRMCEIHLVWLLDAPSFIMRASSRHGKQHGKLARKSTSCVCRLKRSWSSFEKRSASSKAVYEEASRATECSTAKLCCSLAGLRQIQLAMVDGQQWQTVKAVQHPFNIFNCLTVEAVQRSSNESRRFKALTSSWTFELVTCSLCIITNRKKECIFT